MCRTESYIKVDCFTESGKEHRRRRRHPFHPHCHCWDGIIKFLVAVDNFPRDYFPCGAPQAAP